jgi:hypothetical protein
VGKLIFFGLIVVVWAGAAIISSIKQAAAKRGATRTPSQTPWQPASPPWAGGSPPPMPRAARRPQARRVIPPPPAPRQSFAPPPPLPLSESVAGAARRGAPEPAAQPSASGAASSPAIARSSEARSSSIGAADIRRWLTPDVLRGQYFVTEVFDPPPGAVD